MSPTRKSTTGTGAARGKAKTARPKASPPRAAGTTPARRRTATASMPAPAKQGAPPAARGAGNLPLWIVLGALAALDVVFGILAVLR